MGHAFLLEIISERASNITVIAIVGSSVKEVEERNEGGELGVV
ncbi:MAG: hypothetical protein ACRCZI_05625 [Cetobacterium sp.]